MTRVFDISNPHNAVEVYSERIGDQINMLSQSWDGTRVYFTSSLLANWDKPVMVPTEVEVKDEEGNPTGEMQTINASNDGVAQYLKAYSYDGSSLSHKFTVNFINC